MYCGGLHVQIFHGSALSPPLPTELEQGGSSQRSEMGQHLLHESQPWQLQEDQQ